MMCLLGIVTVLGIVVLLRLCEKYDDAGQIIIIIEKEENDG